MNTMGDEADDTITSFGLSEQEMKSYETVRKSLKTTSLALPSEMLFSEE